MQDLYVSINKKSVPTVQPNLLQSGNTYCKAIWAMGEWTFTDEYHAIMALLRQRLGEKAVFYTVDAPSDSSDGVLHWTLFQTNTFPVSTEHGANPTLAEEADCLRKLTYSYPHLEITFRGFSMTRYGLFFCGYPSWDVNRIRADIRTEFSQRGFTIHEPHPQDIAHATLLRLIQPLSDEEQVWLRELADAHWNTELIRFVPTRWEFGFGTWLQRDSERIVCAQWPAHPRWILHRGLYAGPDHDIENREEHLWKQLNDGWDVECDLWRDASGAWWLGHDGPQYPVQNSDALLHHPRAWIHCKNLEALRACVHGSGYTYFSHDVDNAVLTSTGHIWAYPGNIVPGQMSVCVMPERNGFMLEDILSVGAVCSDYLPINFIK
jgi:hypothetical protein